FFSLYHIRTPPYYPLYPYTTLFRSRREALVKAAELTLRLGAPSTRTTPTKNVARPTKTSATPVFSSRNVASRARKRPVAQRFLRSEEHTSELQSTYDLVCRLLLENN